MFVVGEAVFCPAVLLKALLRLTSVCAGCRTGMGLWTIGRLEPEAQLLSLGSVLPEAEMVTFFEGAR